MNTTKILSSVILAVSLLAGQAEIVFAAPALQKSAPITGTVQSITLESDPNTGITTVIVEVTGHNTAVQSARVSQTTAIMIGLVTLDGDGKPVINKLALGKPIEIDPTTVIPNQQQDQNPIGSALATFFSNIPGLDYDTIMAAHEKGVGFGVISQALWLTKQLRGNVEDFQDLLLAKETGDYTAFALEDGTTPKSWGQLRKAVLDGKITHK